MTFSVCDTFFSLPEIIVHLAPLLSKRDLSNLSQSNRTLNSICAPLFWRHLDLYSPAQRFINSPEAHEGCNANIDNVRVVVWKVDASWYYINALWKYLNSTTVLEVHKAIPTDALTHPRWGQLPAISIDDTSIQPLYPLLHLTRYTSNSGYSFSFCCSMDLIKPTYSGQTCETHQHQLLWLLRLNHSTLTQLELFNAPLLSSSLIRDLCRTISQLKSLKTLLLTDPRFRTNFPLRVLRNIFFSCPTSLTELSMTSSMHMSTKDMNLDPQEDDWDSDQGPLLLREKPLRHLESLQLKLAGTQSGVSAPLLSSILEHCPSIKTATLPTLRYPSDVQAVSKTIKDTCPNITDLTFPRWREDNDEAFMIIMDRMHEQRLEKIQVESLADKSSSVLSSSAFLRHSTTLRQVEFDYCQQLASTTLQVILTSCHVLETLKVLESDFALYDDIALSLENAVETEWVCSRIRHLTIYVKLTSDGRDPTYLADPTKSTWTEQDYHHWKMLDQFYTQIGALRELEILSLKAAGSGPNQYGDIFNIPFREACLPGLLALEDTTTAIGQIGFLSRWAGLDKLQELRGSISVTTKEVSARMGQREVEWFAGHLPALRIVTFVQIEDYIDMLPKVVSDLWEQRPELIPVEFL